MLPKMNRGGTVSAMLQIEFGDDKALAGKNAVGSMTGTLLMRGTKNRSRQQIQDEMVKLNARLNVTGGVSGATATIQTTEENLIPALRWRPRYCVSRRFRIPNSTPRRSR